MSGNGEEKPKLEIASEKAQQDYNTIGDRPKDVQVMGSTQLSLREKSMAVLFCMVSCWARKVELELHIKKGNILTPNDASDMDMLEKWWQHIGMEKQLRIKKAAFESSLSMHELTRMFQ